MNLESDKTKSIVQAVGIGADTQVCSGVQDPSIREVIGSIRYQAFKKENVHIFNICSKTYGWAPKVRAACELSKPAVTILSLLSDTILSFEQIYQNMGFSISAKETEQILVVLEKVGFIKRITKHCTAISSINLLLTTRCNMDCVYCYGGKGRDNDLSGGSYNLKKEDMSPEIGRDAVDYLLKTAAFRSGGHPGGINFFGGEPLLNLSTMHAILNYAEEQSKKFSLDLPKFSITTNGTKISQEFIELCNRFKIAVQISFDGTPEAQNTLRPYQGGNGKSSYDVCCESFKFLRKNKINFRVRATLTKHNAQIMKVINNLERLGVEHVHFAIVNADYIKDVTLNDGDIDSVIKEFKKVSEYMLERIYAGKPFVKCNNLITLVETLQKKRKKTLCCGAGVGLLSLVPDGRLFLCHRFAGEDSFCVGHIRDGVDFMRRRDFIHEMHIDSHDMCGDCWCQDLCGGGCPYSNYLYSGKLYMPNPIECKLQKGISQVAIHFASCLRKKNEDYYWKIVNDL
jgi:uncharacterized protein